MSARGRALAFLVAALACAGLAAAIAGGYGRSLSGQLGELRPVLVATEDLRARRGIGPRLTRRALEVRQIPERFVPPEALTSPAEALGRAPATDVAAGEYLTARRLRAPRSAGKRRPQLPAGLSPVEIAVSGAGALAASGGASGRKADVVVTTEPGAGGRGRTYVAASSVTLLSLVEAGGVGAPGDGSLGGVPTHIATLALRRSQALRLIDAESFARQIRLIPR